MNSKMTLGKTEMCPLVPDVIMQKHAKLPNSTFTDILYMNIYSSSLFDFRKKMHKGCLKCNIPPQWKCNIPPQLIVCLSACFFSVCLFILFFAFEFLLVPYFFGCLHLLAILCFVKKNHDKRSLLKPGGALSVHLQAKQPKL